MGAKLMSTKSEIKMCDMREGQIAEILSEGYTGRLVQYIGKIGQYHRWIAIGLESGYSFSIEEKQNMQHRVQILRKSDLIEITEGEWD